MKIQKSFTWNQINSIRHFMTIPIVAILISLQFGFSGPALAEGYDDCYTTSRQVEESYQTWTDVVRKCPIYPSGFATRIENILRTRIELCEFFCTSNDSNQNKIRNACSSYRETIEDFKRAYPTCN